MRIGDERFFLIYFVTKISKEFIKFSIKEFYPPGGVPAIDLWHHGRLLNLVLECVHTVVLNLVLADFQKGTAPTLRARVYTQL